VRSRGACRNVDAVDRVDRERCETRDERGTARDRVRDVRRAMFSAIVALCVRPSSWDGRDMASGELAARTGGLARRLSIREGMSVCYSRAYDGCMRRKRGAGMAGGRKNAQLRV